MADRSNISGIVFNIQRFSIHDGPGIRTTVFLKGCSLHCFWCHNPEGVRPQQEIQYLADRCIGCGECVAACTRQAHLMVEGVHVFQRRLCDACGTCVQTCYSGALELVGKRVTVGEVMREILSDRIFYETSGGGVTLSGGEPVLQVEFARTLLESCKEEGLHTAIQTNGNYPWWQLEALLPFTDLVMMDIKHHDPIAHRSVTGRSNRRILANARRLAAHTNKPILFRVPVVPTVNDRPEVVRAIAEFVRGLVEIRGGNGGANDAPIELELLPFHGLAADKYRSLGREYTARGLKAPGQSKLEELADIARLSGIRVRER